MRIGLHRQERMPYHTIILLMDHNVCYTHKRGCGSNGIWSSTLTILEYPSTFVFYRSSLLDSSGYVCATIFQSVYSINVKGKASMICIFTRAGY